MRVLIVDDEPLAVDWLTRCLALTSDVEVVGAVGDGDTAIEAIEQLNPDLLLLDIQMPGRSGLAVARALADQARPEVIFVTAFAEFAPDGFEIEAADYLLKPVRADRLGEALKRARRRLAAHDAETRVVELESALKAARTPLASPYENVLWVPQRDGAVRVDVASILRIEAARDYALLHTRTKTFIVRMTMSELERKLDPAEIVRVHRSAFVRLDAIRRFERNGRNLMRLHTDDGAVVDVGVSYGKRVMAMLRLDA